MGTSIRRPYLTATNLNQDLLDEAQDNLTNKLEMIANIEDVGNPARTLYVSDRAKYVDGIFYEPRVVFPLVERTIGDWLSGQLEFGTLTIQINNTDKAFSNILMGGSSHTSFIGKRVTLKVGLAELGYTYRTLFSGEVTDVGGFSRDTSSFTLVCRSDFDKVNTSIPNQVLIEDNWPLIEESFIGLGMPIIYGDWTTNLRSEGPEVPAFPVNGLDPLVSASLDPVHPNVGDTPLRLVISSSPLAFLDTSSVTLFRGDLYFTFASSDITIIPATNNQVFDITQKNLIVDGNPWVYETGDQFFVKCRGIDLGGSSNNIVGQGKDMLERFGGLVPANFDSSWATLIAKVTPAENAIALIESRVWVQESQKCLDYVLSMLEQVRVEIFVNKNNLFAVSTLHFDEFDPLPSYTIKNWDVVRGSFIPKADDRNQFNRAKGDFRFSPAKNENLYGTGLFRNNVAIAQAGREISKLIVFPNLIHITDVENQIKETLKLASAYAEMIDMTLTSRSFLQDISDDVILDVNIGSVNFTNISEPVTARIRKIGYDPKGLTIPITVWSFQMVPFPGSEKVGRAGITGGSTAIITKEI